MTSFVASPLRLETEVRYQVEDGSARLTDYIWASFPIGLAFSDSRILL